MGIFSKLLTPSKDKFARQATAALRQLGLTDDIRYDKQGFCLLFKRDGEPALLNLHNIYDETCVTPLKDRRALLHRFVGSITNGPSTNELTPDEAMRRLLPRIRPDAYYCIIDIQLRIQGIKPQELVIADFAEGIKAELVIDHDDAIQTVSQDQLDELQLDMESCLKQARENLWKISNENFIVLAPGLYRSPWQDNHDTSRIFLEDLIWQLKVTGRHVVTMPNRDMLLVCGDGDPDILKQMLGITLEAYEHERSMVALPYVLADREWQLLTLPEDHPAEIALKKLHLIQHGRDYQQQTELLNQLFEKEKTDVFVASCQVQESTETGGWSSYAVWGDGVDTLLPRVDRVAFVRAGENGPEVLGMAPWDRVMEVAGELMAPAEYAPIRYRVREFPTAAQLAEIGLEMPE